MSDVVRVLPLEWREVEAARSDEDPTTEPTGDYEADTPFGSYYIELYFGSDSYGWAASFDGETVATGDRDCPEKAKHAAQVDFEQRVLSCLHPPA